ncbi:MAG TPA: hypothetical protein VFZ00_33450 [Solirubrobacter sp.]|nr:hypothetical protein [Solirubrobacter sp.]
MSGFHGLPAGPNVDPLWQGTLFHRDPLGVLTRCQARDGDIFTLSMPTARRMVVVAWCGLPVQRRQRAAQHGAGERQALRGMEAGSRGGCPRVAAV